jgi:hypothetical protein
MSNNKQTAVDWLFKQLWDEPQDKFTWYAILRQAKEMHKEEIIKFAENWEKSNLDCKEDLYTETFKSDET